MTGKCFFKYFAIAVGVQILLLVLCRYVRGLGNLLAFYIYAPWIWLADTLTGAKGEDTMIVTPVLGWIVGVLLYSLIAAFVICRLKDRRRPA
ncbi:MAG TPA: hypothetical protein VJT74_02045 [Pyrinomonadaceae bacterium]|nr:hypothetical protein [Pyrinomonadaceae bacterium]